MALVTGSGGALGSEMCKQFLADSYDVVVSDLREDAAQEVAKALDSKGSESLQSPLMLDRRNL